MADIRLNLIADLGAFQGALANAVTQAKSTVAPVKVTATIDRDAWKKSLIDAKTLLGTYLKTYKTTIQLDTAKANTQIIALKNKLETDIGGLVLEPIVKPIVDFTDINKLKKEVASVATKPAGASRGETVADLLGKTKGEGGVNIGAIKAIAKELGVTGSSGQELRKALQDLFRAAGEDSIAGLEEGLKNAYATGTTAAKDFSDGFKDSLGIASPSKLFQKFGQFCVEGIANGLLRIDAAAKNAAKDFGYNFETQLDREIQEVGIEKYANQLGKRFGEAFGDSVGITIRGSIDAALSTVMVKGGLAAILGGGKAAIGALPSAAGETGGIAVKTAGLVAQLIKDAFLAGPEELGRNLVANVQAIVSSDSGSIAAALGKITTAFVSGALDAGLEAIRANPQAIGQAAVAGVIAGTGAVVLKRAVPALYDSLVNAIARKVASDIQFTIQAIRNPQQAFAGIQLAIGQVQVSIGYLVQAERRLAGVTIQYGQTAYQLSSELGQSAAGLLKGVAGFLRSTGLVVTALRGGEVGLLDAAKALMAIEGFRRQQIPQGTGFNDPRLLAPTPGRISGNEFAMSFGKAFAQMAGGFINFSGGGGGGRKPPFILPFGEDPNQYGGPIGPASKYPYVSARQFNLPGKRREAAQAALSSLGVEQTGGVDQQKKALAQVGAAYRAGVVSASDYRRAQLQVKMATIDATLPMKGLIGSLKDLGSQFGEATKDILFYGAAYQALGRIQELPRNIYEAVKAQDSFSNSLKATLGAGDTYGQQIQFLTQLSNKYGMNIAETRDGFVKLFASMRQANIATGDVNKLQEATAVIGTAFKLTPDKMDRVTYALGQMASKGQITSEELKGQLGDVLPGAVSQFAAAAGYTGPDAIAKFSKAMEDGTFKGERMRQILVKWAENTTKDFAPAALQAANSIQGLENRLANATTKVYESFSGAIGAIAPNIIYPLIADLGRLSDALNVVFSNTSKRLEQAKKNQEQLLSAQKTGIAPETNLELGFTKGERVKKLDVAKQLADTNVEVATLEGRLKNLSGNQAVQKLATDLQNAANALKNFFDGLTSVLGPIGSLLGTVLTASNSITLLGGSISGLAGAFVSATVILRVFTGLIGFLGLNLIKSNGLTRAAIPLFNILAATAGKTGVQIGLLNNGVLAFQRSAIQGGVAARGLAFGLNLIAKAGPLLIVSGIFYFFDKLGEYLDRNASKVRAFKDQIASLAGEELKLKKIEVGKELGKAKTEFKGYPGGFAGYQRDLKRFEALQKKQRTDRGNLTLQDIAEGTTLAQRIQSIPEIARDRIEVLQGQLGEINNALVRENRVSERLKKEQEKARLEAERAALLAQSQIGAGGDDSKGKGKGEDGGTPQAIGDDFASLMQRIQSDTLKAALEEQRYAFEGAISRLFPRGAGIFQPFLDAYKGVFDFLNDFQERQMQQMESATKTMVSGFRLSERDRANQARLTKNAVVTQRNDPDAEKTGSDISIPGGVGAQIRNPFENMVIKSRGTQGRGSGAGGRGYGNYITGEVVIGGKRYEVLLGHMDKISVNVGDVLGAGGLIGTQGVSGRATGPHVTTHVNPLGGASVAEAQRVLGMIEGAWQRGQVIPSGTATGGGLAATTLTADQQAQIKEAEKALAEQQKKTTAAMLQNRMQDLFNLFEEANLGDKFSKVSTALRDLQRRTEDFGFRAKEAFADFLPEGLKEARKAILSAQKDLVGAQREAEDLRLEFEQMMKQGGGVDRLIAGGLEALKDPQYKELVDKLNSMLALAGKGTLEQAFIAARGSASELRRILSGLGIEIEGYAGNLVTAAEAQKQIAEQTASLTERAASLGIQQQIFQAAGIQMSGLGGEQRRLELEGQIMSLQAGAALNPANAAAIQQRIADLRVLQKLNEDIGGGIATVGDIVSTTGEGFRKFTSDLLMGTTSFQESLVNLLNSFAQYLIDLSLRLATVEIVKSIFGAGNIFGSTSFGLFDTTGGGGGLGSFAGSMSGTWGASSLGGFNPSLGFKIPGFATGGVVTGPTIGLIGEGRYNEAVIPLPDGRSVPVDLGGSTGNQINTNITVNVNNGQAQTESSSSGSDLGRRLEGAVKQVIINELRPGGLISGARR